MNTSTSEVYGTPASVPIRETHPLQGQSPYSASKIAADKFCEAYHSSFGPVVTLRPFNTYGPRQSTRAVLPTLLVQLLAGQNGGEARPPRPQARPHLRRGHGRGLRAGRRGRRRRGRGHPTRHGPHGLGGRALRGRLPGPRASRPRWCRTSPPPARRQRGDGAPLRPRQSAERCWDGRPPCPSRRPRPDRPLAGEEHPPLRPGAVPCLRPASPSPSPAWKATTGRYLQECVDTNFVSSVGPFVGRFERMRDGCRVPTRRGVAERNRRPARGPQAGRGGGRDEWWCPTSPFIAPVNPIRYQGAGRSSSMPSHHWKMDPEAAGFLRKDCVFRRGGAEEPAQGGALRRCFPSTSWDTPATWTRSGGGRGVRPSRDRGCHREPGRALQRPTRRIVRAGSACFSFNGNKILTTGGGGMMATTTRRWPGAPGTSRPRRRTTPWSTCTARCGIQLPADQRARRLGVAQTREPRRLRGRQARNAKAYDEELCPARASGAAPERAEGWHSHHRMSASRGEKKAGMDSRALMRRRPEASSPGRSGNRCTCLPPIADRTRPTVRWQGASTMKP